MEAVSTQMFAVFNEHTFCRQEDSAHSEFAVFQSSSVSIGSQLQRWQIAARAQQLSQMAFLVSPLQLPKAQSDEE